MSSIYLENLQICIEENKDRLTLKELNDLYGEDYIPPYFVKNYGGRIYPFSEFWKQKLVMLDNFLGAKFAERKKEVSFYSQGSSRTWKNAERRHDKLISRQVFGKDE